mgnify:CR=1 FL=1
MSSKRTRRPPAPPVPAPGAEPLEPAALAPRDYTGVDPILPFVVTVMASANTEAGPTMGFRTGLVFARSLDEAIGGFTRANLAALAGWTISSADGFEISAADQQRIAELCLQRLAAQPAITPGGA